jgi:hypothetical protein
MTRRSIKELLQVMLDNQDCFLFGLCTWATKLYVKGFINVEEASKLHKYIQSNRPSKWSSISAYKCRNTPYFWRCGNIKPRVKWIKKHIKTNK